MKGVILAILALLLSYVTVLFGSPYSQVDVPLTEDEITAYTTRNTNEARVHMNWRVLTDFRYDIPGDKILTLKQVYKDGHEVFFSLDCQSTFLDNEMICKINRLEQY